MIPSTEPFETLLSSLSPVRPEASTPSVEVACIGSDERIDRGIKVATPQVSFWYRTDGLKFSALIGKLGEELAYRKHVSNEKICLTILGIFARMQPGSNLSAVARMNHLLERIVEADLVQYLVLGFPFHPDVAFAAGPFRLGELNLERFRYQCGRAGSDFAMRYANDLNKSRLTLTREPMQVAVLPWPEFEDFKNDRPKIYALIEEYYHTISELLYPLFIEELAKVQEITKGLGGGCFDPEMFIREFGRWHISVFLKMGKKKMGWVDSNKTGDLTINFGGASKAVPSTIRMLAEHFGIDDPHIDKIHPVLRSFFHFLAIARDHHANERMSEAFLHLVIALDLVFGEKDKTTTSVSDRVAVLAHRGLGMPLDDCRKLTKKIYDTRSRYVHMGIKVPDADWEEASRICEVVAFAMLRRFKFVGQVPVADDNWLKRIDFVAAAHDSKSPIDPMWMKEIGMAHDGDFDVAEYHKLLNKGDPRMNEFGKYDAMEFSFRFASKT